MISEKKDLPSAKSGRSFFLFCIVLMPLSLSRGEEEGRAEWFAEEKKGDFMVNREYLFEVGVMVRTSNK